MYIVYNRWLEISLNCGPMVLGAVWNCTCVRGHIDQQMLCLRTDVCVDTSINRRNTSTIVEHSLGLKAIQVIITFCMTLHISV